MDAPVAPTSGFLDRWSSMSLARRLMLAAAVWGLLVLVGGAVALSTIYRTQTLTLLDEDLDQGLIRLTREIGYVEDRLVTDTDRELFAGDSRYATPLSGRYWAIVAVTEDGERGGDLRSASLWDGEVPISDEVFERVVANPGATVHASAIGPAEEPLRVAAKSIILENRPTPLVMLTAADRTPNDTAARRFRNMLLGTMATLFSGVFAAMWAGINFSLRPLKRIEHDIAEIREGRQTRLATDYPKEVEPLTGELNKLLEHNKDVVERARTHVGNLAHALKTPLAVLRNEAAGETQLDDVVRRQTEAMHGNVEHYLKRARAAARAGTLGARTEVRPVIDGLARLFNRLHEGKTVSVEGGADAVFRGEAQDFEEMMGNLMDNACKWANSAVSVLITGGANGEALVIMVDDDGPGLTPEERAGALQRGVRLDETTPGTGLGLSIVTEVAELHHGTFELGTSASGGLRAELRFSAL